MKRDKGFILVTILAIIFSLVLLVGGFSLLCFYRIQILTKHIDSTKAYYLASAGAQYGRYKHHQRWWEWAIIIDDEEFPDPPATFSVDGATDHTTTVTYNYAPASDTLIIESTATIGSVSKTLICEAGGVNGFRRYSATHMRKPPILKWK